MKTGATRWNLRHGPAANARRQLAPLAESFFAATRSALAAQPEPAALHRLRLDSKRLRYTLELFRPCYSRGLETRIEALKHIQDLLGDVNDAVTTLRLLEHRRLLPAARAFFEKRVRSKAAEFTRYWREEFDTPSRERWFTEYLRRQAHPPRNIRE